MQNIVQVRLLEDSSAKRRAYMVPSDVSLTKGDVVCVKDRNNKKHIAVCVCNSEVLSDNAIDMVMSGMKVLSWVIGSFYLRSYEDCVAAELANAENMSS